MNKLTSFASRTMARAKFKLGKHGPAIAVGVGLVGMGATVYLAYRAASKIEEAKKKKEENYALVEESLQNGCVTNEEGKIVDTYNTTDAERDRRIYNSRFIMTCIKYIAPPVATFIFSSFVIGKAFKTMSERVTMLGASAAALAAQLQEVKGELDNAVGKEKANDIFLGKSTHTETELKEDGSVEVKDVTKINRFVTGYTFRFDKESSPHLYSGIYERDYDFICGNQRHANWIMDEKKGFVTFGDILTDFEVPMDGLGYALTDGSIRTPGHTIIFDIDERKSDDGKTYFIITVNVQGYIANKI